MKPKLVMRNLIPDLDELKEFAFEHGFEGIDWSFDADALPESPAEQSALVRDMSGLADLEVRYHCPFYQIDLGHDDPTAAKAAGDLFRRIILIVSKAGGKYLTIHIGLGRNSTEPLSWEATIDNLGRLVQYGTDHGVKVCLENLAWGWTSRPNLFEKLIRRSGAAVTFDLGHAHASESIQSQQYAVEDFVTPHADRVLNAHVYHKEVSGFGHLAPTRLADIRDRLDLLRKLGCHWWVIELKELDGLLRTKKIIDRYLEE